MNPKRNSLKTSLSLFCSTALHASAIAVIALGPTLVPTWNSKVDAPVTTVEFSVDETLPSTPADLQTVNVPTPSTPATVEAKVEEAVVAPAPAPAPVPPPAPVKKAATGKIAAAPKAKPAAESMPDKDPTLMQEESPVVAPIADQNPVKNEPLGDSIEDVATSKQEADAKALAEANALAEKEQAEKAATEAALAAKALEDQKAAEQQKIEDQKIAEQKQAEEQKLADEKKRQQEEELLAKQEAEKAAALAKAEEEAAKVAAAKAQATSAAQANEPAAVADAPKGDVASAAAAPVTAKAPIAVTQNYLGLRQMAGNKPPVYTRELRLAQLQGRGQMVYYVGKDGRVSQVRLTKSTGSAELDYSAVDAFSKYRFVPGQEGYTVHDFEFSLKGPAQGDGGRLRTTMRQ